MKIKKVISLLCVLAMLIPYCSFFTSAQEPEQSGEEIIKALDDYVISDEVKDYYPLTDDYNGIPGRLIARIAVHIFNHDYETNIHDFGISLDDVPKIFEAVEHFYPEEYNELTEFGFSYKTGRDASTLNTSNIRFFYGEDSKMTVQEQRNYIYNKLVNEILSEIEGKTDFEKVLYVHDYVVKNCKYDHVNYSYIQSHPSVTIDSQEFRREYNSVTSIAVNNSGICGLFSGFVAEILNKSGVTCIEPIGYGHEWNLVKLDGEWYHLDTTHDLENYFNDRKVYSREGFLENDSQRELDMIAYSALSTATPGWFFYYKSPDDLTRTGTTYKGEGFESTSTKYESLLRDTSKTQNYDNGYWYYLKNGTKNVVCRCDIWGNNEEQVCVLPEDAQNLAVSEGEIYYTIGRFIYHFDIEKNEKQLAGFAPAYECDKIENFRFVNCNVINGRFSAIGYSSHEISLEIPRKENYIKEIKIDINEYSLSVNETLCVEPYAVLENGKAVKLSMVWHVTSENIARALKKDNCFEGTNVGSTVVHGYFDVRLFDIKLNITGDGYSGYAGENITWRYYPENGQLEFNGSGKMMYLDYNYKVVPWLAFKDEAASVSFSDDITMIVETCCRGFSKITQLNLPEKLASIGNDAFTDCTALSCITVPESNTSFDSRDNCNGVIDTKNNMLILGCKNTVIPETVTSIGDKAFYNCTGLKDIIIPETVASIGSSAFYGCTGLTEITIPNSISVISNNLFYGCTGLKNVTFSQNITKIGISAFNGCTGLTEIAVPKNVNVIDNSAFQGCSGLQSFLFPEDVTTIGSSAFLGCAGLKEITIPEGVTSIKNDTFNGCTGLTKVTIPQGVNSIGSSAFSECVSLIKVTIPQSVKNIGGSVFYDCTGLTEITLPENITTLGSKMFYGCTGLTAFEIPENVTSLGSAVFYGCTGLTEMKIPKKVTSISSELFYNCTGLKSIELHNDITSIKSSAFGGCKNLQSIDIPESVQTIGNYAFGNCQSLKEIAIPSGIKRIELCTFSDCRGLTSITIPNTVTSIGHDAFNGCRSLSNITIPHGVAKIEDGTFRECEKLRNISIPEGVTSIGKYSFTGCTSLLNIVIPESVTQIANNTFSSTGGFTIYCQRDSAAHLFAQSKLIKYVLFEDVIPFVQSDTVHTAVDMGKGSITGFSKSMTVKDLTDAVMENWNVSVKNLAQTEIIGTGTVVTITNKDGFDFSFEAVVFGDVTGDGMYDARDTMMLNCIISGMLSEKDIGNAAFRAADCNRDGVIDSTDLELINGCGVLANDIAQYA